MSPHEHGECFVLDDGGECDLDLGNYERFLNISLTKQHNITTGKVYSEVLAKERRGDYLGKTVQIIPHLTDCIQSWVEQTAEIPVLRGEEEEEDTTPDVCLIECGGTVGDLESQVFLEALRQFQFRVGRQNIIFIHVSLVPQLGDGEQKTKPTQHSVKELRATGINPDIIVCRSHLPLRKGTCEKIASFCHVSVDNIFHVHDLPNIFHVPLVLMQQHLHTNIVKALKLEPRQEFGIPEWTALVSRVDAVTKSPPVRIALVGKYTGLQDSYLSVLKSLKHAALAIDRHLIIDWIDAENLEPAATSELHEECWRAVRRADGIVVPGGFGGRGVLGKIMTAKFARESKIPYLGVCLGLQVAVIEYARNVLGFESADSAEFRPDSPHPVIIFMPEIDKETMGGTMRLGARETVLSAKLRGDEASIAYSLYGGKDVISERHRHRYEVNPEYTARLEEAGCIFTGKDIEGERMEVLELSKSDHPFYLATQYHPEFKSRPEKPSPPFLGLLMAAASPSMLKQHLERRVDDGLVAVVGAEEKRLGRRTSSFHTLDSGDVATSRVMCDTVVSKLDGGV